MSYHFNLPLITQLTVDQQAALNESDAIAISGGPGTGKSVISLWRHIRNHSTGKKSLLLTYTNTLKVYLASSANTQNPTAGSAVSSTYSWLNHQSNSGFREIIIDEAQDIDVNKYHLLKKLAPMISYGADDKQILYPGHCSSQSELNTIFPQNRRYELFYNFRNSYKIMQFVRSIFPDLLIPRATMDNLLQQGNEGVAPRLLVSADPVKRQNIILEIVKGFTSNAHNIAVLSPFIKDVRSNFEFLYKAGVKCSMYESDQTHLEKIENVHVTTFKSCKGTEFDTVIIPNFEKMKYYINNMDVVEENDYYVAITRAKRNLLLIAATEPSFLVQGTYQKENL